MATREIDIEFLRDLLKDILANQEAMRDDAKAELRRSVAVMYGNDVQRYNSLNWYQRKFFYDHPRTCGGRLDNPPSLSCDEWEDKDIQRYWRWKDSGFWEQFKFSRALPEHPYGMLLDAGDVIEKIKHLILHDTGSEIARLDEVEYKAIFKAEVALEKWAAMQSNNS